MIPNRVAEVMAELRELGLETEFDSGNQYLYVILPHEGGDRGQILRGMFVILDAKGVQYQGHQGEKYRFTFH